MGFWIIFEDFNLFLDCTKHVMRLSTVWRILEEFLILHYCILSQSKSGQVREPKFHLLLLASPQIFRLNLLTMHPPAEQPTSIRLPLSLPSSLLHYMLVANWGQWPQLHGHLRRTTSNFDAIDRDLISEVWRPLVLRRKPQIRGHDP